MASVLSGFTIGVTGDRRADEQAELLTRRGAEVVHGPMIETRALADSPELRSACDDLLAMPPDLVIATTGVGVRSWMEAADGMGLGDDLRSVIRAAEVLARSPKAAGALVTTGLTVHWQAPGERSDDVVEHLAGRDLSEVRVAVQRDGSEDPHLARALAERGAEVVDVPVYRWVLPADLRPAHRLLDALAERHLDAITVTSAPALVNMLEIAADRPDHDLIRSVLAEDVVVACVGPVCSERARAEGIGHIVQPERFRLGSMIKRLTDHLAGARWRLVVDGCVLEVQGTAASVDGREVRLGRRVQAVLTRLADADGAVVSKADLARTVWGPDIDPHVVEVTVGRARAQLGDAAGAVVTVPRRGYRLAGSPTTAMAAPGTAGTEDATAPT